MARQTKTAMLDKLLEEAKAAGHQRREAEAEAQGAHAEVARRREAAAEAHASGGDVDAAIKTYHEAETALDEARIKLEGHTLRAERARAATDNHMQEHHLALLEDLEPEAEAAMAKNWTWQHSSSRLRPSSAPSAPGRPDTSPRVATPRKATCRSRTHCPS